MKNEIEYLEQILETTLDRIYTLTQLQTPEPLPTTGFSVIAEKDGFKVMRDNSTGLIWSDRVTKKMDHYQACKLDYLDDPAFCGLNLEWRLPTIEEYEEAEKNNIRDALPNMNYWFWSSSVHADYPNYAWLFYGDYGGLGLDYRNGRYYSVRCVAR